MKSKKKKIVLFGCKSTSKFILNGLIEMNCIDYLVTIDEEKGRTQKVADYQSLTSYSKLIGIPVYVAEKYSLKSEKDELFFREQNFDIAFVIGWQRLVPRNILNTFSIGAFGMHGSAANLPKGRGRSPMNWAIIEGRKVFYTNLFKYDDGVDSGDILDTVKFCISDKDTGETMHFKNTLSMKYLIKKNISSLIKNKFQLKKQLPLDPTYYPKRNEEDSLIDWEDDIFNIERLIRAVTRPFNGAYSYLEEKKIVIYQAQIFDNHEFGYQDFLPGQVVEIFENGKFLIKVFGGLLLINEYRTEAIIFKGGKFSNGLEKKNKFDFNRFGFYDLYQ